MASTHRKPMLESEIRKVLTKAIADSKNDYIKNAMPSIVRVELSKDLRFANVFVSALGESEDKQKLVDYMNESKGMFRTAVAKSIRIYKAPEITFKLDIGIDASLRIAKILEQIQEEKKGDE